MNWQQIRAEYISGSISQRQLALKYGIPFSTLQSRAKRGKWGDEKKAVAVKITENAIKKTAESVENNTMLAEKIKRKGLETLDRLFDEFMTITATEHRDYTGRNLTDIKRLRDLTAAYRDLTEDIPKAENMDTMEKLDAMLAEVRSHAANA